MPSQIILRSARDFRVWMTLVGVCISIVAICGPQIGLGVDTSFVLFRWFGIPRRALFFVGILIAVLPWIALALRTLLQIAGFFASAIVASTASAPSATSSQRVQTSLPSLMSKWPKSNVCSTQDLENPSASVHRKRFLTPSLAPKSLCTGELNLRDVRLRDPPILALSPVPFTLTGYY